MRTSELWKAAQRDRSGIARGDRGALKTQIFAFSARRAKAASTTLDFRQATGAEVPRLGRHNEAHAARTGPVRPSVRGIQWPISPKSAGLPIARRANC
jgi:hypothetical protein